MGWTYKGPGGRVPAAHEVRELRPEVKGFLRTCTGHELMREIRAMLDDQPIEIVDATAMLDYLCELRDTKHSKPDKPEVQAEVARAYVERVAGNLRKQELSGAAKLLLQLADAAGVLK